MYSRLQLAEKYLNFYYRAANGKGHGIHSPFVYDLVRNVLRDRTAYVPYAAIEGLRRELLRDETVLEVEDLGAGPAGGGSRERTLSEIARHTAKPTRLGRLLFRLARYYRPSVIVELGTSLGLSTAYLAKGVRHEESADPRQHTRTGLSEGLAGAEIWTIEGSRSLAGRASENLARLGCSEVKVLRGNFDDELIPLMRQIGHVDLAFVDGNHRFEPTLRYFEILFAYARRPAILVFDDIHWSAGMERAWEQIKADPRVLLTIDLFFFGLVVCREELKVKQDFAIRFWK